MTPPCLGLNPVGRSRAPRFVSSPRNLHGGQEIHRKFNLVRGRNGELGNPSSGEPESTDKPDPKSHTKRPGRSCNVASLGPMMGRGPASGTVRLLHVDCILLGNRSRKVGLESRPKKVTAGREAAEPPVLLEEWSISLSKLSSTGWRSGAVVAGIHRPRKGRLRPWPCWLDPSFVDQEPTGWAHSVVECWRSRRSDRHERPSGRDYSRAPEDSIGSGRRRGGQ